MATQFLSRQGHVITAKLGTKRVKLLIVDDRPLLHWGNLPDEVTARDPNCLFVVSTVKEHGQMVVRAWQIECVSKYQHLMTIAGADATICTYVL